MTISTSTNEITYTGDAVSVEFAYPYPFITTADIKVYVSGVLQVAGYTVVGSAPTGGSGTYQTGTVTFSVAPAAAATVLLYSDPDQLQSTALPPNDPFPSKTVEKMIDKVTLLVQRVYGKIGNALIFPVGDANSGLLPSAADRANKLLSFDSGGAPVAIAAADGTATTLALDLANAVLTTKGSAMVGYIPPGTSSVGRTVFSIIRERRRLTDKLLTTEIDDILAGTGAIDITTKFQIAVADAAGRVLELPEGRIRADGMSITGSRSTIVGAGGFATKISAPTAAGNVFTASNTYIEIRDVYIDSVGVRSGGWYVDVGAGATRFRLKNFYFDGFLEGIRNLAAATATFEQGYMYNGVAATGIAIRVGAGADISIRDVVCDQVSQLFAGIYVTATSDLTIEDCNFIHCGQGLYLAPGAGQVVASVWANNSYFDTSSRGLYIAPTGAAAAVVRCIFDECWFGGHTSSGAEMATSGGSSVSGMDFNGCHVFNNAGDGIKITDSGVANVRVNGGAIAGNTGSGFSTGANVSDFSVQGARIGNTHGLAANGYGIFLTAGTGANFQVCDNDLRGNTTLPLSDSATGTGKLITDNLGFGTGSAVYDPPSLADGVGTTTTVTVTGAALGDQATATFSLALQGITVTAWVSAADTVSVRFQNESGGVLDLASGTLRASITRRT